MTLQNKAIITGRVGADPDVKRFDDGGVVVNLRVATSEKWRDKQSGDVKERTEWHSISLKNEAKAKFAEQYIRKGDLVQVEGSLHTREWTDRDGIKRYSAEIQVRPYDGDIRKLASAGDSNKGNDGGPSQSSNRDYAKAKDRAHASDLDDDVPF